MRLLKGQKRQCLQYEQLSASHVQINLRPIGVCSHCLVTAALRIKYRLLPFVLDIKTRLRTLRIEQVSFSRPTAQCKLTYCQYLYRLHPECLQRLQVPPCFRVNKMVVTCC